MNSTNHLEDKSEKRMEVFFNKYILPLYAEVQEGKRSYFSLKPEKGEEKGSYFDNPKEIPMTYFTLYSMSKEEELKQNLEDLWEKLGDDSLVNCAAELAELAMIFKKKQLEQPDELNPYVYAMF